MHLKEISIQECHILLLQIATIFEHICQTHNIPYYMLGGTMLGAIRHKGFIPWDDDMDFGIPRPYFNRFLEIAKNELPESYEITTPMIQKGYVKIQLKGSRITEKIFDTQDNNSHDGIAIDIFPLDGANKNSVKGFFHLKIAFALLRFQEGKICSLSCRTGIKKILAYFIKQIPINNSKLSHFIDKWIQLYDYEQSPMIANFYGHWKEKEIMNRSIFSSNQYYNFEKIQLKGTTEYHTYLTLLYNKYMQLPPKEKQITHASEIYILVQ